MYQIVCTIITCVWGLALYIELAVRGWKLIYRWPTNRPLSLNGNDTLCTVDDRSDCVLSESSAEGENALPASVATNAPSRMYLDASHWLFSVTLVITLAELIISTVPEDPYIKLLAMVNPSMVFSICVFIFVLDIASFMHFRAPFRISSVAEGEPVRPGIYTILEDTIAVDLGEAYAFRSKFNEAWLANPTFRRLLSQLSFFWSLSGLIISGGCTVVIFTTDTDIGFAVGWGLPFLWAMLWTCITVLVVNSRLSRGVKN
jgi:hypothetical protein